jgi:hypothetical protein
MPITTVDPSVYGGDSAHFRHVLDHLFTPAIMEAGLTPISPIVKGSDVIHAEIIRQLEQADIVLCDVSGLNANVFFELGIRTALNRPVCLVKDDETLKIPFDTTLINHHTYKSSLSAWDLESEIEYLSTHIKASFERSEDKNSLWRHFGLSIPGRSAESTSDTDSKLTLLAQQIQALSQALTDNSGDRLTALGFPENDQQAQDDRVIRYFRLLLRAEGIESNGASWGEGSMQLKVSRNPSVELGMRIARLAHKVGYSRLDFQLNEQAA